MNHTKERIVWIDALKGFATICVVAGHVFDGYLHAGLFPESQEFLAGCYNGIYIFHMALFFLISGMTCRKAYFQSTDSNTTQIKDKTKYRAQTFNLIILYVVYSVLMGLFKILATKYVNRTVSFTDIALIWGKPIAPYWYLYVLVIYYLLFSIDRIRNCKIDRRICLFLFFIVSLLSGFVNTNDWFQIQRILQYSLFFYLGFQISDNIVLKWKWILPFLILSCVSVALYWNDGRYINNIPIINVLAALGIVLFVVLLFQSIGLKKQNGVLAVIGKHSLEIYLLHCFFTAGNRLIFGRLGINNVWISVILNVIISTSVPILLAFIAKRIKIYNIMFSPIKCKKVFQSKQSGV